MKHSKIKQFVLLLGFLLSATWCGAYCSSLNDGLSHIAIKATHVQGCPKGSSIQATIDGHVLSVVFLENLGQVHVKLSLATGGDVDATYIYTPNGVNFYIPNTGSYVVTIILENGDEYYGEFEVTD
ncbi:MAG: hypothetical protein IKM99_07420 [Bacteroidales bacterium]|nr:hypothetical protein [Bacteroidales bacterium]